MKYIRLIRHVHRRLLEKHSSPRNKNLLAVGLGWDARQGKPGRKNNSSLVFFVRKGTKARIPPKITLTHLETKRGVNRRRRVTLNTRVIEIGQAVQTGLPAYPLGNNNQFLVGALVAWGAANARSWGFLTVGHGLAGGTGSVVITLPDPPPVTGTVIKSTLNSDPIDAALIRLDPADVGRFKPYLPADGQPLNVRTLDQLAQDGAKKGQQSGVTLSASGQTPFVIQAYVPAQDSSNPIIPAAPNRIDLLYVEGVAGEFQQGTSGAVWLASSGDVDAVQVAGMDPWDQGFGQAMEASLEWAAQLPAVQGHTIQVLAVF